MNPKIENRKEIDDILTFTLSGVDVSFANAIRRIILSEIPIVVFKTMPYDQNKANIMENTSRLNNEIIKQRLSCIPIHIKDIEMQLKDYIVEIDEENKTDTIMMITTEHFKIKNINTNKYLEEKDIKSIFPPYVAPSGKGEYYINFVRLRPKISEDLPGEKLKLTCEFSIDNAKNDSMFNVAGTCAYGYTPDPVKMKEELDKHKQKWKDEGKTLEEIEYESKNWSLLEGLRYVIKNSFDFIIESVGIFDNEILVLKACEILVNKFKKLNDQNQNDELIINPSINTMENCYDVILEKEDYTIGNILNYILYTIFYRDTKQLTYCGFKKMHPHDEDSIIRLAFESPASNKTTIKTMLKYTIDESIKVFTKIIDILEPKSNKNK
jgi:DNA-directed RNA polymerase alpha subunit